MPYIELIYDDCVCFFWQSGKYFYRRYNFENRARRISVTEYMSAYEEYYNL